MRGRPVLGALAGLLLGALVVVDLVLFGIVASDTPLLAVLPPVGVVLGVALGLWAPLGRGRARRKAEAARMATAGPAPSPPSPAAPSPPPA